MRKSEIVEYFTRDITKKVRKNEISPGQIAGTLITASLSFVNESCKSSGQVSKSQVIYRKLVGKTMDVLLNYKRKASLHLTVDVFG